MLSAIDFTTALTIATEIVRLAADLLQAQAELLTDLHRLPLTDDAISDQN